MVTGTVGGSAIQRRIAAVINGSLAGKPGHRSDKFPHSYGPLLTIPALPATTDLLPGNEYRLLTKDITDGRN